MRVTSGPFRLLAYVLTSVIVITLCLSLSGCDNTSASATTITSQALQGAVHGGQQPVSGATIQLYAAGTNGYGVSATPLLTTPVLTDSQGRFTLPGDYTCPLSYSQLYITATGGNPGLAAGTSNGSLALMTALGPCTQFGAVYTLDPNRFIAINEVTTVASVYALRAFMSAGSSKIGAGSRSGIGIDNSFQVVNNLVNTATGSALATTPAGNGTPPQALINTLADIIAPCINSTGTDGNCTSLFAAATATGQTVPTDTIQAVRNIASAPTSQIPALYGLINSQAPFQPTLSAAPNDWTMAIKYTGGNPTGALLVGTAPSQGLAIDASGNVWVLSSPYQQTPTIAEFSNTGTLLSGSGYTASGLGGSTGIAIDPTGNVWVTGSTNSNVVKFSSSGTVLSGAGGYTGGGLNLPTSIAMDGNGKAWIADATAKAVIELNNSGTILSGAAGYALGSQLSGIGIDQSGNAWVSGNGGPLFELNQSGALLSPSSGYSTGGVSLLAVGFDGFGNIWTNSIAQSTLAAKLDSTGNLLSPSGGYATCTPPYNPSITGRTCYWDYGQQFALDGAGNMWITAAYIVSAGGRVPNPHNHYAIGQLSNTGAILSGTTGYTGGYTFENVGLAIDGSGNVWVVAPQGFLLQFVGAANPVVTPFSVGLQNGTLGTRP
jgi:hypothetical protein